VFVPICMSYFELSVVTPTKCWIGDYLELKYLIFLITKYVLRLHYGSNWCRHNALIISVWGYYIFIDKISLRTAVVLNTGCAKIWTQTDFYILTTYVYVCICSRKRKAFRNNPKFVRACAVWIWYGSWSILLSLEAV
jgi:hypothetical protein